MKLWILRPIKGRHEWKNPHDKNFGFVVRAETEWDARYLANRASSDEGNVWDEPDATTCIELSVDGDIGIIISDFHAG